MTVAEALAVCVAAWRVLAEPGTYSAGVTALEEVIPADAGADYVKTSTGFATTGAKAEEVHLMRQTVGPTMGVKAAGGIRDLETALAMIEAGASRLGCSASISIVNSLVD